MNAVLMVVSAICVIAILIGFAVMDVEYDRIARREQAAVRAACCARSRQLTQERLEKLRRSGMRMRYVR